MQERKKTEISIALFVILMTLSILIFSVSYAVLSVDISGTKNYTVQVGTLDFAIENEENSIGLLNAYPMSDTEGKNLTPYKFTLRNTGTLPEEYKIYLIEDEEKKNSTDAVWLDTSMLRYSLIIDGTEQEVKSLSPTTTLDSGILEVDTLINYELRLWLKEEATLEEQNKIYYGKIRVEAFQTVATKGKVSDIAFASENLGESCKTYDDGVETFLVGQCSQNYVSYSGKLWRVVSKNNETGIVKLVTEENLTNAAYYTNNTKFENGGVYPYLTTMKNQLSNPERFLINDTEWKLLGDTSAEPIQNPTTPYGNFKSTAGLLSIYDYYVTYAKSDGLATNETGYLNNHTSWLTLTMEDPFTVRSISSIGELVNIDAYQSSGIRPVIYLKASTNFIESSNSNGTLSNPYKIEDESSFVSTVLFQNENLGESCKTYDDGTDIFLVGQCSRNYLTYSNNLWRVVSKNKETGTIKIVMQNSSSDSMRFGSTTDYESSTVKTWINEQFLPTLDSIESYVPATRNWYSQTHENAKKLISTDILGLLNEYEYYTVYNNSDGLATSEENYLNNHTNWWTFSNFGTTEMYLVFDTGQLSHISPTSLATVRPALQLKKDTTIMQNTASQEDGTQTHPYSIKPGK